MSASEPDYGQYIVPHVDTCVNFKVGQPSPKMLPLDAIRKASAAKFEEQDPLFLQYGNIRGFPKFRESLCKFLTGYYGVDVTMDKIMATNGNTGALALICSLFTRSGDTVYAEEPTYFLAKSIFADFKLNVVQIPMDENGLDVDALEAKLKEKDAVKPVFMYVIPTAHNPTGRTMPAERRAKLIQLAIEHDFKVVADEVYQLLTFPQNVPPPPMCAFDKDFKVLLAMGTFSKILCPGLRVGWLQANSEILTKIHNSGQLDSSGGLNPVCFGIVQKAIDLGIQDAQIKFVRESLWNQFNALKKALDQHLPSSCSYEVPTGGYFLIIRLPSDKKAVDLLPVASKHKVQFLPGSSFGDKMQNYLRLSFSYYEPHELAIGAERLASAISEFLDTPDAKRSKE